MTTARVFHRGAEIKARIQQLIETYRYMLKRNRSKIRAEMLENVITDLETALRDA